MQPGVPTLSAVVHQLRSTLVAQAAHVLGDRVGAEDIVQDAYLELSERFESIDEPERWLRTVVHRRALNEMRRRGRERAAFGRSASGEVAIPVEIVSPIDVGLARALAGLSATQRSCVVLCWADGLSTAEAAGVLGCATPTVRVHLHRARRALRAALTNPMTMEET
jgi:RNA polymerase sigma-70 factor (ECF subfamily)